MMPVVGMMHSTGTKFLTKVKVVGLELVMLTLHPVVIVIILGGVLALKMGGQRMEIIFVLILYGLVFPIRRLKHKTLTELKKTHTALVELLGGEESVSKTIHSPLADFMTVTRKDHRRILVTLTRIKDSVEYSLLYYLGCALKEDIVVREFDDEGKEIRCERLSKVEAKDLLSQALEALEAPNQ